MLALRAKIKSLRGQVSALKAAARAKPPPSDTQTKLRKTIAQLRHQLHEVTAAPNGVVFITKASRKKIRMALEPDKQQNPTCPNCGVPMPIKKVYTEAFQIFETLPLREVEPDARGFRWVPRH